ncbi:hypothetical protein L228DRAFT_239968 [Xylona heveae TC161]|uniref:Cyanobacterial phytochrome B n=1 Tax=Xylona heveae (strain CBS 132557 / TC161) TaxID=1328760 RepID=A0A165FKP3_XYLHT|nr:hypothetical protein L228DRAFT_239968 [Xylona heveae TC161]KZF21087.1 hypothetical protein L228DRAFT_239968 [Xylona heveae TC161]
MSAAGDGSPRRDSHMSAPLTAQSLAQSQKTTAEPSRSTVPPGNLHLPLTGPTSSSPPTREGPAFSPSALSEPPSEIFSPASTDRVFPIRSVVSVDPYQTPAVRSEQSGSFTDGFPFGSVRNNDARRDSVDSIAQSRISDLSSQPEGRPGRHGTPSVSHTPQDATSAAASRQASKRRPTASSATIDIKQLRLFSEGGSTGKSETNSTSGPGPLRPQSPSIKSIKSTKSVHDGQDSESGMLVTSRFKHTVVDGGHAVITGRGGETLQRCEDEPIHIPGAVQSFGFLLALQEESDGRLVVRIVSENSKRFIGYSPRELFDLESFTDILSEEQADNMLDHVDFVREDDADPATNGPEVFTMSIRPPGQRRSQKLWCAMHVNERHPELVICEFELEDDTLYPLVPAGEPGLEGPEDTLNSQPNPEEYAESTETLSKPLRILRSARKRKSEAAAMEVFNIMSQIQEQLSAAPTLERLLKVLVGVVKELTGFHRVMIYQFDQAWNGKVVTELVDPRATLDLYNGLHFPASDIPKQARDLYKINKVRLLYDREQVTARLVCRTVADLETPLDMTYAYLRAMSPIHIKYLANMGVRASMSISINAFNELWGLISCHSYGSQGMRVSFPIRKMCRLIGDSVSRNIERLSYASRLQARKLINTVSTPSNPSGYIIASSEDLLNLFDADLGLLSIRDETKILGKLEQPQEALALLEYLRMRKFTSVMTSQDIREDFPDLRYPPGFQFIAGLLFVPLSIGGLDFIVFFRKAQVKHVKWAGNPYDKVIKEGTEGYLEPRTSFKTWSETVVGKCREWSEEQIETAAVLCLVYGKFIDVWRQKEAALQTSELTRLLLANSAHEVRTPLNAIINYLEIALEGAIDSETREYLAKSHSASKSLIYVINDLLDLTKAEEGHNLVKFEPLDLIFTIREAFEMFQGDAKRKQIDYQLVEHPGLPTKVIGDQRKIRQAISNIIANAIQHTTEGFVRIEAWPTRFEEGKAEVEISVEDSGVGMSVDKLDTLFTELEQVQAGGDGSIGDALAPSSKALVQDSLSKKTLGLGLAVVSRTIRNMNGQLRVKSEEGKGSRFVIQLLFDLPEEQKTPPALTQAGEKAPEPRRVSEASPSPAPVEGELLLVDRGAAANTVGPSRSLPRDISMARKDSNDSVASRKSLRSLESTKSFMSAMSVRSGSGKSDVERLIDAIQEPTVVSPKAKSTTHGVQGEPTESHLSVPNAPSRSARRTNSRPESGSEAALRQVLGDKPGEAPVTGSRVPVKPVRMPDEDFSSATSSGQIAEKRNSRVSFDVSEESKKLEAPPLDTSHLNVLVAEDDPVNSKIVKKRLEKLGHEVYLTVNGEECAGTYGEKPGFFDVVLMDMQMPIVDGLTSTKMIRSFEKTHASNILSARASLNGRVPIFAVSASLVEKDRHIYTEAGFDGWILKPIDFKRLSVLFEGIGNDEARNAALYEAGEWERGGWFVERQPDLFAAKTAPSDRESAAFKETSSKEEDKKQVEQAISGSGHEPNRT